jgi:hypothetical protein
MTNTVNKPKEIASDIIAEGMLKEGKDEVSNVYRVFMEVQHYIIKYMEEKRERDRKAK